MFERFSERARQVVVLAQDEARLLGHEWIGTEHLLAALLAVGGVPAAALEASGLELEKVRVEAIRLVGRGEPVRSGQIPFTPVAKRALEVAAVEASALGSTAILPEHLLLGLLAQDEARALKHNYMGTEHILLGLLREEEGLAARVLESLDITVEEVRARACAFFCVSVGG